MPVYQVGDLIRYRLLEDPSDWDAIGVIIEMCASSLSPQARILWADGVVDWYPLRDIYVVQNTSTDSHKGGNNGAH